MITILQKLCLDHRNILDNLFNRFFEIFYWCCKIWKFFRDQNFDVLFLHNRGNMFFHVNKNDLLSIVSALRFFRNFFLYTF